MQQTDSKEIFKKKKEYEGTRIVMQWDLKNGKDCPTHISYWIDNNAK